MKKFGKLAVLIVLIALSIVLCSCNKTVDYTIYFEVDGEIYHTISSMGSETIAMPANPTKDDYTFDGWYWDKDTWEKPFTANSLTETPLSDNMTVYARWKVDERQSVQPYTLTFDSNCDIDVPSITKNSGESLILPTPLAREGYTFDGWYIDDETFENRCTFTFMPEENKTLYAKWTKNYEELAYSLNNGGTAYIVVGMGTVTGKEIEIPSLYKGLPVETISDEAFKDNTYITSVTIPSSINELHKIFSGCSSLTHISLSFDAFIPSKYDLYKWNNPLGILFGRDAYPNSIKVRQCSVFNKDDKLYEDFYFPKELKSITIIGEIIPMFVLKGCENLTSITISDTVEVIEEEACANCTGLTELDIPDSVTNIDEFAFSGCTGLTSLTTRVHTLGYKAFSGCIGLLSITFGSETKTIGNGAFAGCTKLTSVCIPNSVISIGNGVFWGCNNLTSISLPFVGNSVKQSNSDYQYPFGYIFSGGYYYGDLEIKQTYYENSTSKTIEGTFYIPSSLKSVTLTGTDSYLPYGAFSGCNGIRSITLPDTLKILGDYAFYGCSSLSSITLPEGMESLGKNTFNYCSSLTSISIPESITSIDICLFANCTNLISATIPEGVKNIGNMAFYLCSNLTSITIPNTVQSIENGAFSGCSGLISATLGTGLERIENSAFSNCYKLIEICNRSSLSIQCYMDTYGGIGKYAKYVYNISQSKLTSTEEGYIIYTNGSEKILMGYNGFSPNIVVPDDITSISPRAFKDCTELNSITIGRGVTEIGDTAFYNCYKLIEVNNLSSLTFVAGTNDHGQIAKYAKNIYSSVSGASKITTTDDGYVIYTTEEEKILINYIGVSSELVIPKNITSIYKYAFCNNSVLNSVIMENGLTSIGEKAFLGCINLTSVYVPGSVTSIGKGAFDSCNNLTSITLPLTNMFQTNPTLTTHYPFGYIFSEWPSPGGYGVEQQNYKNGTPDSLKHIYYIPPKLETVCITGTKVLDGSFYKCKGIRNIILSEEVTTIGIDAFWYCFGLTSINIPDSVTSIGNNPFNGCSGITSIVVGRGITEMGEDAFSGCENISSVEFVSGLQSIGKSAFDGCEELTSVIIPNSVVSIGEKAFFECNGLTSIAIGNGVTSIGKSAFYECSGLTSITIPDSVTSIGSSAFKGCSGLTSITIPDSVTSIDQATFSGCYGLTSITIPDSVTSIGEYAFYGCCELTSIIIPDSVTSIDKYAFTSCSGLTSINIPDSVTSIGIYAFYKCSGLTSITIPDSVTSIGESAFEDCYRLTSVTIGNSVTSIGESAFEDCYRLTSITIPNSVTGIGGDAFLNCYCLIEVYNCSSLIITAGSSDNGYVAFYAKNVYTPSEGNSKLSTDGNGYVLYTDDSEVTLVRYIGTAIILTIPNSVTSIGSYAFSGNSELTSVTIPDNVTFIGSSAFSDCRGLTSVTIGNSVTSIGSQAFANCWRLASITISGSVTSIGSYAFNNCSGLISITIPDSVTSIGWRAFSGCSKLTSVTFETTSGWYCTQDSSATSGTSVTVTNTSTNATYLKSAYFDYYWKRNA